MKKFLLSVVAISLLIIVCAGLAQAATFWESTFDAQDCNWRDPWSSCLDVESGVMHIDLDVKYAGAGSLLYLFDWPQVGSCDNPWLTGGTQCGGYWDRPIQASSRLHRRFWLRLSTDFVSRAPGTKIVKIGSDGNSDWLGFGANDNNPMQIVMSEQTTDRQLWTSASLVRGQWHCIQLDQQVNTPGVANGTFIMKFDGINVANYTDVMWRLAGDNSLMNYTRVIRQNGRGTMWMDNYAVGDTEISCGAAPPPTPDVTAPGQVQGLTSPSKTATTITYTWTANAESDLHSYILQGCTGGGCTNWSTLGTVGSGVTTYTWNGRTASTLYRFRVAAQDNASPQNVGQFSSIVDVTTFAASTLPTVTSFDATSTGGQIGYTGTPTDFRIGFGGTNGDGTQFYSEIFRTLAEVPGGLLSFNWPPGTAWACVYARDNVGAEDPVAYRCDQVTPAAPGGPGAFLRALASNLRWLTLDGITAIFKVGISGGNNCNASFCGLQDLISSNPVYTQFLIPSTTIIDTFDGTAADLGSSWTGGYTGGGGAIVSLQKVSGEAYESVDPGDAVEARSEAIFGNQTSQATLGTTAGAGFSYIRPMVNMSEPGGALNGYSCAAIRNGGLGQTSRIDRVDNGISTTLASENATTWAASNIVRCRRIGRFLYLDRSTDSGATWVTLVNASDATYRTGRVGLMQNTQTTGSNGAVTEFRAGPIVADYVAALNAVVAEGGNWVRYWTLEQPIWGSDATIAANDNISIPFDQFPWFWTGGTRDDTSTGTTVKVGIFNIETLNQAFFDRVSARIDAALARGITPIITMFSGGHLFYGLPPSYNAGFSNPFYFGNNVNGISCDTNANEQCEELHTLNNTTIVNAHKAYINKLVQTIGNRPVILEVSNEDQTASDAWQNMVMDQVRTAETTYGTNRHIIFQSGFYYVNNSTYLFTNARPDAVSPLCTNDGVDWDINPPANDGTKLIFYDNDHQGNGTCGTWTAIVPWKLFTRAIYPIYLSERETAPVQTAIKTAMAQTLLYSTKINLATAYPETGTSIFSTSYGLFTGTNASTPNCGDYLMLMPTDGSSTINLTACGTGATFTVEYFNLTSGATTSGGTVNGGALRSFNPAGTDPMVVLLKSFVPADTTPPVVSGGSPTGVLASGTASVSMTVITNENATCKYGTIALTAYASIAGTFSTTGGTTHSQTIAGLADGNNYDYFIRCQDVAGNANTSDFPVSWSVTAIPPDVAPPTRTAGAPSGVLIHTTTSVSMTLTTDEAATCKYGTIAATAYASIASTFTTTGGTSHSQTIAVSQGNTYTYYIRCTDGTNPNIEDYTITWQVAASPDVTPPVIVNCQTNPFGVLPSGTTSVTIECNTDENATIKMDSSPNIAYASMATTFGTTGGTFHSQSVGGLADNTSYTRYLRASDGVNPTTTDYPVSWTVAAAPVSTIPADVTNVRGTLDAQTGTILWQWDAVAGATYYIVEISRGGTILITTESGVVTGTSYEQGGLTVGTYVARVKAVNNANQQSVNWVTSTEVNAENPPQVTGLTEPFPGAHDTQVILTWTPPSSGSLNIIIERCTGVGCTDFAYHGGAGGLSAVYSDVTVSPGTTYRYRAKYTDIILGGTSVDWSALYTATTLSAGTDATIGLCLCRTRP